MNEAQRADLEDALAAWDDPDKYDERFKTVNDFGRNKSGCAYIYLVFETVRDLLNER